MRKSLIDEYEQLVVVADELHQRIEACGSLMDKLLFDVYRGERNASESSMLFHAVAVIHADLVQQHSMVRVQKALLAGIIDRLYPFY